jgi:uncharacterized protein (DUF1697 family)
MTTYIAFLRAINVGGHRVSMSVLKDLFLEQGFQNVKTYIASGNIIFDSKENNRPELERKIEQFLESALGYGVSTFIRTQAELQNIIGNLPFPENSITSDHVLYVAFLKQSAPNDTQTSVLALENETDNFRFQSAEMYWLCNKTMPQSKFSGARFERLLKNPATFRNITMLRKLALVSG